MSEIRGARQHFGQPIHVSASMSIDKDKTTKVTTNAINESAHKNFDEILDELFEKDTMEVATEPQQRRHKRPKPYLNANGQIAFYSSDHGKSTIRPKL